MNNKLGLAVFVSGGGTNLQAFIDACKNPEYPAKIEVVVCNKTDAYGIKRAQQANIPTVVVPHRDFPDRKQHEQEIIDRLQAYPIDLVVLAGYMRVITSCLLEHFYNKKLELPGVINIHPADTKAYQGAHGYEYAFGALEQQPKKLDQTKITVHFVDTGVDTGPIIKQEPVPIFQDDTLDRLKKRGLEIEHQIYPEVIRAYALGRIKLIDKQVQLDT